MQLILMYMSRFSVLIPLILIIIQKNRFKIKTVKLLSILLLVSVLTDIITFIMGANRLNSSIFSNLFTFLEFLLLALLYTELLPSLKKLIYWSIGIFIAFFLIDSLVIENLSVFQSYTLTLEGILLMIYSTLYYIEHQKRLNTQLPISEELSEKNLLESTKVYESIFNSTNQSNLYINSAVFFYFVMDIYLFSISNYVFRNESVDIAMTFWSFHNFCNIIKNGLFAAGIYYVGQKKGLLTH